MAEERSHRYQIFLLRCWEERRQQEDLPGIWRFSLKEPRSGKQRGFGSLEALVEFLATEFGIDDQKALLDLQRGAEASAPGGLSPEASSLA